MPGREKIDVAINVFAKPWRTSLAILSLLGQSGQHIGKLWFQFEPMGIQYDAVSPYCVYEYLIEKGEIDCAAFQPEIWLGREALTAQDLADAGKRQTLRYQFGFENSRSRLLFLMHNDIFVLRDLLGPMQEAMDGAFAIGQIGQCWNCPANNAEIAGRVMAKPPCSPASYLDFQPDYEQLCQLYQQAQQKGIFTRPYDKNGFTAEFASQPWPLPECRVNEWALLLDLEQTRPLCQPNGPVWPPGAYRSCGEHNLDIGVAWFRDMHANGLKARHFNLEPYLKHWVGTGNNTPSRYAKAEDLALSLLKKHYGHYINWAAKKYGPKALGL